MTDERFTFRRPIKVSGNKKPKRENIKPLRSPSDEGVDPGNAPFSTPESEIGDKEQSTSTLAIAGRANEPKTKLHSQPVSAERVATFVLKLAGVDAISELANNPSVQPPGMTEEVAQTEAGAHKWLTAVFKSFLSISVLQKLDIRLSNVLYERRALTRKLKEQFQEIKALESKHESDKIAMERRLSDLREQSSRVKHQLYRSTPLKEVIALFLRYRPELSIFNDLLNEALDEPSESVPQFIMSFLKGLENIHSIISSERFSEDSRMNKLDDGIRILLRDISGLFIPQRRALLSNLAKLSSQTLETFEFRSPEDDRVVDTRYHNVTAAGGEYVREALSFVVIGKPKGQTIRYADISVN